MPTANWGISASDVDDFDRDSQYKPYSGPIPPNGTYAWLVKVLKMVKGAQGKFPQLRIGLELIPREDRPEEDDYEGYFVMNFVPISPQTAFRYAPFCDAIGVTGREFTDRTKYDREGNVRTIGKWRNTGDKIILAELKDGEDAKGASRKEIGYMGPFETDDEDEEDYDDEYADDE